MADDVRVVLDPQDEFNHDPGTATNFNESMYFNVFDGAAELGGWFRMGNRANEGHAELSACIYLPDGRVGFMFKRPEITSNEGFDAGGMRIDVVEPFEQLTVSYEGRLCLMDNPFEMADPAGRSRTTRWSPASYASTTGASPPCTAAAPFGPATAPNCPTTPTVSPRPTTSR